MLLTSPIAAFALFAAQPVAVPAQPSPAPTEPMAPTSAEVLEPPVLEPPVLEPPVLEPPSAEVLVPVLTACRQAAERAEHEQVLELCAQALADGTPSIADYLQAEEFAAHALHALGRNEEAEQRLLTLLVLDPELKLDRNTPTIAPLLARARERLVNEGRIFIDHDAVSKLHLLRQTELVFVVRDPLARVGAADAVFEFIDATESRGFARVPLSRKSLKDGRATWSGGAPAIGWPPRWVRYHLELMSPSGNAVAHGLPSVTLKPAAGVIASASSAAEEDDAKVATRRQTATTSPEREFSVLLASAATFSAIAFGSALVTIVSFGVAASAPTVVGASFGVSPELRQAARTGGQIASIVTLLGAPITVLIGGVSAGLWAYYAVSDE